MKFQAQRDWWYLILAPQLILDFISTVILIKSLNNMELGDNVLIVIIQFIFAFFVVLFTMFYFTKGKVLYDSESFDPSRTPVRRDALLGYFWRRFYTRQKVIIYCVIGLRLVIFILYIVLNNSAFQFENFHLVMQDMKTEWLLLCVWCFCSPIIWVCTLSFIEDRRHR